MDNRLPGETAAYVFPYVGEPLPRQEGTHDEIEDAFHHRECTAIDSPHAPVCWLFHELPAWNRSLRNIGLQLEEADVPGKLSLVEASHNFVVPHQELYRHHARILFHMLVVSHRCVTGVDLSHALFHGGTLDEINRLPVRALFENANLRILNVIAEPDCTITLRAVLTTIATMIRLQELRFTSLSLPLRLVQPLRTLIFNTTALKTLDISELHLDDREWKRLLAALMVNRTVTTLSVHSNIMVPRSSKDVAYFSRYLQTATWLASLSVTGLMMEESFGFIKDLVEPLLVNRTLVELTLVDFRLDSRCLQLLGRLVAHDDILAFLDITNCMTLPYIYLEESPPRSASEVEQKKRAESNHIRSFIRGFGVSRSLKVLAIDLGEFSEHHIQALYNALAGVASLQKVIVVGIISSDLRRHCSLVRDAGMHGRVSLPQPYRLCPAVLNTLDDGPGINGVAVDSLFIASGGPRYMEGGIYSSFIRRLPTCSHLTSLWLMLDEKKLHDTMGITIRKYLMETTALKDLRLLGYEKPDLRVCTVGADKPVSLLLEALAYCRSVSTLHVKGFFFGDENLRFLAELVCNSHRLCEVHVSPVDENGHTSFIRYLAPGFARNRTLLSVRDPYCVSEVLEYETPEELFKVEDVLIRNRALITCAAEFVVGNVRTDRCAGALEFVYRSHALVERIVDLACVDELEAVAMIRRRVQEFHGN